MKNQKKIRDSESFLGRLLFCLACVGLLALPANAEVSKEVKQKEQQALAKIELGRRLYFETLLSDKGTLSCASCHSPATGFIDMRFYPQGKIVALGDDGHSRGNRNVPTASYAAFSPSFHYDPKLKEYVGGQFWDGRADTLAEQAGGPPLNPVEMNMADKRQVIERLKGKAYYLKQFKWVYGEEIFEDVNKAYLAMTDAIESFEKTKDFSPFDSKYDLYLKGEYELSVLEDLGMTLFFSNNNVSCATCHKLYPEGDTQETFTNFQYRNIGVPKNFELIELNQLGEGFVDRGLAENPKISQDPHLKSLEGRFKVPTLRNVAVTGPYMHNGVFKHLRTVVEFYDKFNNPERKINPETGQPWGDPEVPGTVDLEDLAAKKLTDRKVDALVAFMRLLTDQRYEALLKQLDKEEEAYWKEKETSHLK